MDKYICKACGYVYDPVEHDNRKFEDLSPEWVCPLCRIDKGQFVKERENRQF